MPREDGPILWVNMKEAKKEKTKKSEKKRRRSRRRRGSLFGKLAEGGRAPVLGEHETGAEGWHHHGFIRKWGDD